jgi:hypothetical protein
MSLGPRALQTSDTVKPSEVSNPRSKTLVALVVVILIIGAVVVYQQFQLSALSSTISHQSSELTNPSSSLVVLNFTVTKLNATTKPVMYLGLWNNGTTLVTSGGLLVEVYGQGGSIQSCYNGTSSFPSYSNETATTLSLLSCGNVGDGVELTATVEFASSAGFVTKVLNARTTISQSEFTYPPTVVVKQIGIWTVIVPDLTPLNGTVYNWSLTITNESPTPIANTQESAVLPNGYADNEEGCVVSGAGFYGVSAVQPLPQHVSCSNDGELSRGTRLSLGERFTVDITVTYINQTKSSVSVTAMVEPPYVLYQVN